MQRKRIVAVATVIEGVALQNCPVRATVVVVVFLLSCMTPASAAADLHIVLEPPVDGPISRPFQAPEGPYGAGHRGLDYSVSTGTRIRAAAAGTVTFAGTVAGVQAVTIQHFGGVRTTYSVLSRVLVSKGEEVEQGQWIGLSGLAHPGSRPGLHFGTKVDDIYVDPATLLGGTDVTNALHLAPLAWRPVPQVDRLLALPVDAGDYRGPCSEPAAIGTTLPAPDKNIAVAIAGIASKTAGGVQADLYEYGPERLGYPAGRVFRFSYRGIHGPLLHHPYQRTDTYNDLHVAAAHLRHLLAALGSRFPGVDVDLFAHSQGGLVARMFLESQQASWDPRFPRVDHLVTLATPNQGAPLAGAVQDLADGPAAPVVRAVSRWSRSGSPMPDPLSEAVSQLEPGSSLQSQLARQDVAYGTQVLTLASPLDLVVPADKARIPGKLNRIVPPNGSWGHSAIVRSEAARRIEYSFLRGGPVACRTAWDHYGSKIGSGIDWVETHLGTGASRILRAAAIPFDWARRIAARF